MKKLTYFQKIMFCTVLILFSFLLKKEPFHFLLLISSYLLLSYKIYQEVFENIKKKDFFDEKFLMVIATLGAFMIHSEVEAVLVMLLFQIGEYLEDLAISKSEDSITSLMDLRVEEITLEEGTIKTEDAKIGDIFLVHPGDRVPLDGVVIEGESYLDMSSLTGETTPKKVEEQDFIHSGCVNVEGVLKVQATSTYETSTAQRILDLVKNAEEKKSDTETIIRKIARVYTPLVCLIAFLLCIIPPILGQDFKVWFYRALIFLVTSCPCALVISVPLGYFCGLGKCSKEGIIVKGSKELEKLAYISYLLVDKTGTITEGVFEVIKIKTKMKEEEFLQLLASAESSSNHPIAKAIQRKYDGKLEKAYAYHEISGKGIACRINQQDILVGNKTLFEEHHLSVEEPSDIETVIYLAVDQKVEGYVVISDRLKKSSQVLKEFSKKCVILSGDNEQITKKVAQKLNISKCYGNLLPEDKVRIVEEYKKKGKTIFVGDGINDAAVLKVADVGISMGRIGSDAAIEASDVIIMNDDLRKIKEAINISRLTQKKTIQSITLALAIKILVLFLSLFGISTMILAVFADVGVTFIAIINVLTIFFHKTR